MCNIPSSLTAREISTDVCKFSLISLPASAIRETRLLFGTNSGYALTCHRSTLSLDTRDARRVELVGCRTSRASTKLASSQCITFGKVRGKKSTRQPEGRYMHGNTEEQWGREREEEIGMDGWMERDGRKEEQGARAGNPNEYLISAYLTPGKVQSNGMAGSLPGGWKEEPRVPCTSQQPP